MPPIAFRFWLNAGYLTKDTKIVSFLEVNDINVCDFVPIEHPDHELMVDHADYLSVLDSTKLLKTCE